MSLAAAGVLALPVTSFARPQEQAAPQQQPQQQQPPPAQPQPAQPQPDQPQPAQPQPAQPQPQPTQPQPTQPQPTEPQTPTQPTASATESTGDQTVSPQEHLRQAQQAASAIQATSIPAKNRAALAELKHHLSNLEKMGSTPGASTAQPSSSAGKSTSAKNANWGTEVAAVDKIITEMVGSETASPSTSTPGATGTTGAAKPGASSATIDDATRATLMEVRTHITAYAAGMAGAPSTPKTEATTISDTTAATAAHAEPSMSASPSAASPTTPSPSPSSQAPAATPSSPQSPAAGSQNPPSTQQPNADPAAQQPPAGQAQSAPGQQPSTGAEQPGNAPEAHKYLVAARDTLSQLTQLPAAAQLSGESRTQVAQLITNFNELIGNPPDWHVSYQKVAANLTSLLGPDNSAAEAQGGTPTTATGATATPGAVGTAGAATTELDPTLRAKLVEFRRSLNQFEKAAGGTK